MTNIHEIYGFSSKKEWETYCLCLHKAVKGDRVLVYVTNNKFSASVSKTTIEVTVDCKEGNGALIKYDNIYPPNLLIATNNPVYKKYGFYSLSLNGYTSSYIYGYWIYPGIRIAKIFK